MCEVVVGIDFGSSGTGYAYSFNNPENINLGTFENQGTNRKVPTEIILDKYLNIKAFGEECKQYIEINRLNNGELYFKNIKMNLYSNQNIIRPENCIRQFNIIDIIAKVLIFVKKEALREIKNKRTKINEENIKYVVTVPAIWNEKQKGIMIKASEKAGLFNKSTNRFNFFALEPEAAALYCSQDKDIDPSYIMPGKTYTICDLGGGTGDIVTHNKNSDGRISEKYHAIGGNYGSDEIDKAIFKLVIYKLFGFKTYNSLKKKLEQINTDYEEDDLYQDWIKLENEIKNRKKIIKEDSIENTFSLNIQIFQDFTDNKNLKEIVDNFNQNCPYGWNITIKNESRWILNIPNKIFFDLINNHASKISEEISQIHQSVKNVECILYVGGYCANKILINSIKEKFKNIAHLTPHEPDFAVVKGAVLFGINPNIIKERKAKYTLGTNSNMLWDELRYGLVGGEKYYDESNGKEYCKECFDSFIQVGQNISINDVITRHYKMVGGRYCSLKFYKSFKKDPIFCNDPEIDLIGEDLLDLQKYYPEEERDLIIKMKFGGTFVEATCIHEKSGKEIKLNLYFDKVN